MSQPPSDSICEICHAIDFAKLPFEDEPGAAHQPSLAALRNSAETCALCSMILKSALLLRVESTNSHAWDACTWGRDLTRGGTRRLPSGTEVAIRWRDVIPDVDGSFSGPKIVELPALNSESSKGTFRAESRIRPWLYGNWRKDDGPNARMRLMGMGVRLGELAGIEHAEGSYVQTDQSRRKPIVNVKYWGTLLRLRAPESKALLCYCHLFSAS